MSVEQPPYHVLRKDRQFELRRYEPYLVAEIFIEGRFTEVGNRGFRILLRYLLGQNSSNSKMPMSAPVIQQNIGEGCDAGKKSRFRIAFTLPHAFTMASLPSPKDPRITLREINSHIAATRRYEGNWGEGRYLQELQLLERVVQKTGLTQLDAPIWARFNAPFSLPVLRRNEIHLEVRAPDPLHTI